MTIIRVAVLTCVVAFVTPAVAGVVFNDGLVHSISDNRYVGCMVDVRSGPGGATTTLNVLPGAVIDAGADATALNTSTGERSTIHIAAGTISGSVAGFVCQTAGPHTISGGTIDGGKWGVVLQDGEYAITGGTVTGAIPGWFRTNAIIDFGEATLDGDGAALITENARVDIRSGDLRSVSFYAITTSHTSLTYVHGGSVTGVETSGSSTVIINGGTIANPPTRPDAVSARQGTVHIHGGTIESAPGPELTTWQGDIYIHGTNFNHPVGRLPVADGGSVSGTLEDGTPFSWTYSNINGGAIHLMESSVATNVSTWGAVKSLYR